MEEIKSVTVVSPDWIVGRYFSEKRFCKEFLSLHPMAYQDGCFYDVNGRVPEEEVRGSVYDLLSSKTETTLSKRVNAVMDVLKMECRRVPIREEETLIHCKNGTYSLGTESFTTEKHICRHRLPVAYNPNAPEPKLWISFLNQLLEDGDTLTLQDFLGYCLMPVNYAQKMLLIIGSGGEGKSRIGIVLHALLGQGMCNGSLAKVESSPFARADLQNRLVMVDDDLSLSALSSTHHLKSLITAEQPMDLERKGVQSYQGKVYCRFLAFGNGSLRALHDRSHGFFRRQIILTTKEREPDREDDPFLAQRLKGELEGILLWCIAGAQRLIYNDMQFIITPKAKENSESAAADGNNVLSFLNSQGYIRFDPEGTLTSRRLYSLYTDWCEDNMLPPLSARSFVVSLNQSAQDYGLHYSNGISAGNGRRVRGFSGIRGCEYYRTGD